MNSKSRIFVAGHRGLVGSAIVRKLRALDFNELVFKSKSELDLTDRHAVDTFFAKEKIDFVFLAAAKVGGIGANSTYGGDFIRDNLFIQTNVIDAAYRNGVQKLLFLGSSCIYPKFAEQPIREDSLLTGPLEPTNKPYAVAKIAGIEMCQAYRTQFGFRAISLMPTNLYGQGDNFNLQNAHVLPALITRFHEAKESGASEVVVWGSGTPRREFLHVDDMADACVHFMKTYDDGGIVNIGVGDDITIRDLVDIIAKTVGYKGALKFDTSKPDGTPRKLLDVTRANNAGWKARIGLEDGIRETYAWFKENASALRR